MLVITNFKFWNWTSDAKVIKNQLRNSLSLLEKSSHSYSLSNLECCLSFEHVGHSHCSTYLLGVCSRELNTTLNVVFSVIWYFMSFW